MTTVSIGICAHNEERRISGLLESLIHQPLPSEVELREVVVVASGCTDGTEDAVNAWTRVEPRIKLIREDQRKGKSSALNVIFRECQGDVLILVNADARLQPLALQEILVPFQGDWDVDVACGFPVPEGASEGLRGLLAHLLWGVHNRTLETLSDLGMDNHCCDEFMALRRGFLESLPEGIINDGAYLGVLTSLRRRPVRFCPRAKVDIEIPGSLLGLFQQRRRILRGHHQVERLLAHPPNTLEGMAWRKPGLVAGILLRELWERPVSIPVFLFIATPMELWANLMAHVDDLRSDGYQPAWPMVG